MIKTIFQFALLLGIVGSAILGCGSGQTSTTGKDGLEVHTDTSKYLDTKTAESLDPSTKGKLDSIQSRKDMPDFAKSMEMGRVMKDAPPQPR